jgi:hypothetical protein
MKLEAENNNSKTMADQTRILDKFLVDNAELEELSARLSIFNIFNVLRIEQAEIRHSNVLAWLLDPQGSHGIGQAFLRRVLSTILLDNESAEVDLTPAQVELMDMMDVEVWREWRNIDLIAFSQSNKWVVLFENKIKGSASRQQLVRYIQIVKKAFPNFTIIPVLLTLVVEDGLDIAEESEFISWSHEQMYHVLNHVFDQRKEGIPQDANVFFEHYLVILRRITMQDEKIVKLCKAIYKKHKDAIDLIVEWGATSEFGAAAENFLSDHNELKLLHIAPRRAWFVPVVWEETMPPCSNRWKQLSKPYPIACYFVFRRKRSKMGFVIEIGSMEDSEKRLKLVKAFDNEGFKIGKKALRPESIYTRVYSIYREIENPDDQDEIRTMIDNLWEKSQTEIGTASNIIKSFKWE